MNLDAFASASIPQDLGDDIFNSALETLTNTSIEEGFDPTLVAEKCANNCFEMLETSDTQVMREYNDCKQEIEYFIENARQRKILDFLVKLLEHPSVQRQEILFNVFSIFLTERKHSNYLILAYLLLKLSFPAFEQFHNYVGLSHSINGNSLISYILVSGVSPEITEYDRIISAVLIYHSTHNSTKLASSFKSLIDLYLNMASSRSISKVTECLSFPPKNLLFYIFTVLLVCPDLLKPNIFITALSQVNLSNVIELEVQGLSEVRLTEGFEVKMSNVYMNMLNSLAATCLHSSSGYANFFIIIEHVCSFSNFSGNPHICSAVGTCEEFQREFFEKILKSLFSECLNLSQPKFNTLQEFEKLKNSIDSLIMSFNYIPKLETYNPKNLVSLLFLIGLYEGETMAKKILTELITHSTAHRNIFIASIVFLNTSFTRYWPDVTKSVLSSLLSKNYYQSPKKLLVLLNNLEIFLRSSSKILLPTQIESLSALVLKELPLIIIQAKNCKHSRLMLGILGLADACISCVNNNCIVPNFTVTLELLELFSASVKKIATNELQLNIMEDNIEQRVVSLIVHACKGVADVSFILDGLLDILWANSCDFSSPLKKEVISALHEQSDISKHLYYSLFEEVTGVKGSTCTLGPQSLTISSLPVTLTDTTDTQILRSAQKYVISLMSNLIQSNQEVSLITQKLFLSRFSHLSQTPSNSKHNESTDMKHLSSKRSSELWHTIEKRRALWDIVEMFSQDELFLLKAVSIFIPLVKFITYLWSGKKSSGDVESMKNRELTIRIFRTLEKLAPAPLNKASLILNLIAGSEIAILSRAIEVVLETSFHNQNIQRPLQASDIPCWDSVLRDIRHLVTENIHTIGDIALFFLVPQHSTVI